MKHEGTGPNPRCASCKHVSHKARPDLLSTRRKSPSRLTRGARLRVRATSMQRFKLSHISQGAQCCKRKCQKLKCTLLRLVLGTNQGCLADKSSNAQSRTWHARYHLTIGAIRLACSLEDSDMSSRSTSFQLILRSEVPCLSG